MKHFLTDSSSEKFTFLEKLAKISNDRWEIAENLIDNW